jgi:hypothetical protein
VNPIHPDNAKKSAPFFMSYVLGEDRGQAALLPAGVEGYVAADALVRGP